MSHTLGVDRLLIRPARDANQGGRRCRTYQPKDTKRSSCFRVTTPAAPALAKCFGITHPLAWLPQLMEAIGIVGVLVAGQLILTGISTLSETSKTFPRFPTNQTDPLPKSDSFYI